MAENRELDREVAEKVMGTPVLHPAWPCGTLPDDCDLDAAWFATDKETGEWLAPLRPEPDIATWYKQLHPVRGGYRDDGSLYRYEPIPFFSTSIAAAFQVVEKMRSEGWLFEVGTEGDAPEAVTPDLWYATFSKMGVNDVLVGFTEASEESASKVICLAALKAVEGVEHG